MPKTVQIALPIPADKLFSYEIPDGQDTENLIGRRALVPFGSRVLTGVILGENSAEKAAKLKSVNEILDEQPIFSAKMLELMNWIADYYICSPGEALRAAIPQGMSPESLVRIRASHSVTETELNKLEKRAPKRGALLRELMNHDGFISVGYLERILNSTFVSSQLQALSDAGLISIEKAVNKQEKPKIQKAAEIPENLFKNEQLLKIVFDELDRKAYKQSLFLSNLYLHQQENQSPKTIAQIAEETNTSAAVANALEKKGYVKISEMEIDRSAHNAEESLARRDESLLPLTEEQQAAFAEIENSIDTSGFRPFLLHGVTGSGKTLVYIHAIKKVREMGKSALILVPEISLTPQLIDRFEKTFPGEVAVYHSRMSQGERYDAWRSLMTGRRHIMLGARSGLFAPLKNLGLIVVDEEHESSYKQDSPAPRYNARDCAIKRADLEQCTIVLGSATPSIESSFNAREKKFRLLEIKSRADSAKMPLISVIDMGNALKNGKVKGAFSDELFRKIVERLTRKEGIILFQNRRGFSAYMQCKDCQHVPECRNCTIKLTYHKNAGQLRCHYCGYTRPVLNSCPECQGHDFHIIGSGTQRIEDELDTFLRQEGIKANIERLDLDTTSKKGSQRKILTRFARGETDILVGTQMVAKGLDFERVSLVGVVSADVQLYIPDFRASERTFQLLTQVAGRAGRHRDFPGEVLIQTFQPDNYAIQAALAGDYSKFYNHELNDRLNAFYPPFSRFGILEFTGKNEPQVHEHAEKFYQLLPKQEKGLLFLGPTAPEIVKIRNNFRRIIVIKNIRKFDPGSRKLRDILRGAIGIYREKFAKSAVNLKIDIDSYNGI